MLSSSEAYQLLKLPLLVHHFHEHNAENPAMSFAEFWAMHYLQSSAPPPLASHAGHSHDADPEDAQLPFKHHTCSAFQIAVDDRHDDIEMISLPEHDVYQGFSPISFYASDCLADIWQPPKYHI